MKKLLCLLLALLTAISMTACSMDTSEVFPELSQIVDELIEQTYEPASSEVVFTEQPNAPPTEEAAAGISAEAVQSADIPEDGSYTSRDDVALYIHTYGRLPQNFITKKQARELGWSGGSLEPYAPGKCIGGDHFGNYDWLLPDGHSYTECDINTLGSDSRGAERIIFSDDGLIYYTGDHYASFTLLYGEE